MAKRTMKTVVAKRFYSLLTWHECRVCRQEFVRMKGFKVVAQGVYLYGCFCGDCAQDQAAADKLVKERAYRPPLLDTTGGDGHANT